MTSSASAVLAVSLGAPPVLLWAVLGALLAVLRRRGKLPAGALRTVALAGVGANLYPLLAIAGADPSWWVLVAGLAMAAGVGYGYMLAQRRRHVDPVTAEARRIAERYRVFAARIDAQAAGVDAPAADETETP